MENLDKYEKNLQKESSFVAVHAESNVANQSCNTLWNVGGCTTTYTCSVLRDSEMHSTETQAGRVARP